MQSPSTATPSLIKSQCYIGGQWSGVATTVINDPATGAEVGRVPDASAFETRQAIEAAYQAFPVWSKMLAKDRAAIMRRWHDLILQNADALAELLTREQGKPLTEAKNEIVYGASFIEFFAEEAKRIYGETIPTFRADSRIVVLKQPIGVVAAITPWNFPNAMITRKIAPALAAGCTVLCKPAESTPLSALALAALADQAGFPPGVINIITSTHAAQVGAEMTSNPHVRAIAFTGSTKTGALLMAQAAPTIKRVSMELGGNAPFIVFDDADIPKAVEGAIASKFRNSGQTCVCANRFYVQDKVIDVFTDKLVAAVKKLRVGPGMEPDVAQGPLINKAALDKVKAHVDDAIKKGATLLTGGKPHSLGRTFFEPTVLTSITPNMLMTQEETFGPVAPIIRFGDEAEVIALANATPFGLAGYFYARDIGRVWRVAEALECGMVSVNSGALSTELAPFGGVKQSGIGREGSRHGIEEYIDMKYVLMGGI